MTTKNDFSAEEWELLTVAPVNAGSYIITADLSVMGAIREMKALGKALKDPTPPAAAQELVTALITDAEAQAKNKEEKETAPAQEGEEVREQIRQALQQTATLLDAKCTREEAAGFKQWLQDVAQAVAEADKEGSHFGIGGQRVSDKEQTALAELTTLLNP
jgi:5-formyltetrahydrofolate cyclo-ligase